MTERNKLMKEIMAYSFAAFDWNLYLNTHPNDRMALMQFRKMSEKATELKNEYAKRFGPLTTGDVNDTQTWTWISDPWPWNN